MYYHDEEGKLCSLLAGWTSVSPVDPFVVLAAGRSPFRLADLLELCRLVEAMGAQEAGRTRAQEGKGV